MTASPAFDAAASDANASDVIAVDVVAVVTVNWNGWAMTLECLASLRATRGARWHLIVVDNASTDDSLARLRGLGADVTLIESPVNGGWTGGNNLGLEWALAAGHERVFILNNDALVEPDTIARLMEVSDAHPDAVLGPIHLDGEGTHFDFVGTDANPRTGLPLWKSIAPEHVAALPDLIPTVTIKGAGILMRSAHLRQIGLFDDRFYLNFDESDWCYRARAAGLRLLMVKSARIRHLGSGSIGGGMSPLQSYFLVRNGLLFAERHCTLAQRWRQLRELYWNARDLPRDDPARTGWIWRFIRRPSPAQRAFRRGILDYCLRRFGDCPPRIRALNRQA